MNFGTWQTRFDSLRTLGPKTARLPLAERVRIYAGRLRDRAVNGDISRHTLTSELERLAEEYLWLLAGKPYYNVHPLIVPHLSRCRLDKIPASYLEVPGGFDAVHVGFAAAEPCLSVSDTAFVRAILFSRAILRDLGPEALSRLVETGVKPVSLKSFSKRLRLYISLGKRGQCDGLTQFRGSTVTIYLHDDKTLDEEFFAVDSSLGDNFAQGTRGFEVLRNCVRLLATVGFMCNQTEDGLLEYDVLAKDRQRFSEADEEGRQRIIDRARRRGKIGWNVGTNEMFVGEMEKWSSASGARNGREHTRAHIRSGHLHAVRCGEGRRNVKIKWFRPTVVRPDLPFAERSHPLRP